MSKYINIQGQYKTEKITGILKKKNGSYIIETKLHDNDDTIKIPLEDILEDFENKGVKLKIQQSPWGEGLFKKPLKHETIEFSTIPLHPEYQFASQKAQEKFLDMKFGMMIHWGVYSQLGVTESWCAHGNITEQEFLDIYYTLWQVFNPVEFNADEWAALAERAGMQFFQFTTKHHDGFCMFNTKTKTKARKRLPSQGPMVGLVEDVEINYSIMDGPFKRDIVKELIDSFRKRQLGIGLYYSNIDWNDPNFRWDSGNRSYDPSYGPETHPDQWNAFIERQRQQLREIFSNYGPIDQIFFDASWPLIALKPMEEIILMCRKLQPDCMMSDRGLGPYGDFTSPERWIPDSSEDTRLDKRYRKPWQVCDPIHNSWAYLPDDQYKSPQTLLKNLIDAISKGGTYVFAVSPMPNGKFPEKTVKILEYMGDWLKIYGEAIYGTRKYSRSREKDREIYYTQSKDHKILYLIYFGVPNNMISVSNISIRTDSHILLLGTKENISWHSDEKQILIKFNENQLKIITQKDAFALKMELTE